MNFDILLMCIFGVSSNTHTRPSAVYVYVCMFKYVLNDRLKYVQLCKSTDNNKPEFGDSNTLLFLFVV